MKMNAKIKLSIMIVILITIGMSATATLLMTLVNAVNGNALMAVVHGIVTIVLTSVIPYLWSVTMEVE